MNETTHAFSGRYRSEGEGVQLELRVDVDGRCPMRRISGDLFEGAAWRDSFIVDRIGQFAVEHGAKASVARMRGDARWANREGRTAIELEIPYATSASGPGPATCAVTAPGDDPGQSFECAFRSRFLREAQWELDWTAGMHWLVPHVTGDAPSAGGPSVQDIYAGAGVRLNLVRKNMGCIPAADIPPGGTWTQRALHDAMEKYCETWGPGARWKVYMLITTALADDANARGCMFDKFDEHPRQGCAVFGNAFESLSGVQLQRELVRTCVHELGHCFNLPHPWAGGATQPVAPEGDVEGYDAPSWMNLPESYTPWGHAPPARSNGRSRAWEANAYWERFPFRFTDRELVHLRHAFYLDIVFGGGPYVEQRKDEQNALAALTGSMTTRVA